MVTPGVEFLANFTLHVLSKPVLLAVAVHYVSQRLDVPLPLWATALLAGASIPVYAMYSVWISDRRQRREAESMGARMVPRIKGELPGNLDIMQMMIRNRIHGYPGDGLIERMEELGPIVNLRILWTDMIITIWPEHIKAMLATDFNNFEKGARFQKNMASVLGTGVFNSDGDMWKFHRGMTRPFFNKERVSHFDTIDTHAELVVSTLKSRSRAGHAIDFQDLIGRFTMDSATETLFGTCVDSLKGSIPYAHNATANAVHADSRENTFVQAFNDAMEGVAVRDGRNFLWPLWEIWKEGTHDAMQVVNAFLDPIIEAAVERKRIADAMGGEKREAQNLLDELLNSTSDPKILKDETLNILLAGRDTTMHTLTMIIYFLSIHPAAYQRLRSEVLAHVGPTRRPTYDDIKDMKYLRAVINEALRLYPPVPFNVRDSIEATTWPSPDPNEKPIYIPAHTKTPYSVLLMQRSKDLWGPDAEEFDPDRFLDERLKKYLLTNAFQFLPFNAGPRICLGQQFAYNEMSFMLIRLLQSFSAFHLDEAAFAPASRPPAEWKNAKGRKAVDRFRPKMHLTMSTLDGMWVRVTEAGEEV
ncbi:cytochrome P450 monooxygenase pc-1 [Mycena amicta]|nr:cytochrome P450 monooxygenase pc-1 [Mycena amicta]